MSATPGSSGRTIAVLLSSAKWKHKMPIRPALALVAALFAASHLASAKAQDWPAHPVKIIIGFSPGSSADQLARLVGEGLSTAFKQRFFVEYRQGNSGSIAASFTARAAPDGYTLMIGGSGPHITIPTLHPDIGYDPMKDFTHIAMIAGDSYVLAANPTLGLHDLAGLIKLAKTRDVPLTSSSPGPGSLGEILLIVFKRKAGIEITHVPAPDSGMMEVLGNHINMTLTAPLTAGEQLKAGKVIGLAMSSRERNPAYPTIATSPSRVSRKSPARPGSGSRRRKICRRRLPKSSTAKSAAACNCRKPTTILSAKLCCPRTWTSPARPSSSAMKWRIGAH